MQGSQFDFDVADVLIFDADEDVELAIEFDLQTSSRSITLAYDKNGGASGVIDMTLPELQEARFHTESIVLERARFAGRGDYGTDLMLLSRNDSTTICGLSVSPTFETETITDYGWLSLATTDEDGSPVPVRVGLYDQAGRAPLPSAAAIEMEEFSDRTRTVLLLPTVLNWPSENRYAFYIDGEYRARLPEGTYTLVISRGFEYRIIQRTVLVEPGAESNVAIELERWTDMPEKLWYSGDVHIHAARRDGADNEALWSQARAEDLHVGNVLQMDNIAAVHFPQSDWGESPGFGTGIHRIIPGQEGPRTGIRGHTVHLDIQNPVRLPDRYLLYHEIFERMSQQGGLSGYAHTNENDPSTRAGLALEAPFGLVKFVEVMQSGYLGTDMWFDFLNLGYKIAPAAGSDYPFGGHIGDARNYVRIDGAYSSDGWFDGLEHGRTFVTNGPMVEFQINDAGIGDEISIRSGETMFISSRVSINPDIDLLDRLELIEQGDIVATVRSDVGAESLELERELVAEHGTWFVIRAYGKSMISPESLAQSVHVAAVSAPIYVSVNGQETWKREAVRGLAAGVKADLNRLADLTIEAANFEWWETRSAWALNWPLQYALFVDHIRQVVEEYDQLVERSESIE